MPSIRLRSVLFAVLFTVAFGGCSSGTSDALSCAKNHGGCAANATCTEASGKVSCACPAGYSGDGVTCTDVDECATGSSQCSAERACLNTPGSYTCADCPAGYANDGPFGCTFIAVCGDGRVDAPEQCDDGNTTAGDGCSASCQLEPGWQCPTAGASCSAAGCGDGIVAGDEQCDTGASVGSGACSKTCTINPGYVCVTQGSPPASTCHAVVCGDGVKEGAEACDDGNLVPYDGCSPTCTVEPRCQGGTCTQTCGDGLKFPQEQCDDGNTDPGDGCSPTCTIEQGWECTAKNAPPPSVLSVPILYRDMLYAGTSSPAAGHPDFQAFIGSGPETGLVKAQLGVDGEPVWASNTASNTGDTMLTGAVNFCWWFHEKGCAGAGSTNPYDRQVYLDESGAPTTLQLQQISSGVYQYSNQSFFPIDGLGWNAGPTPQTDQGCSDGKAHNFSFTSELHYVFTYSASASPALSFTGDDDVWVFINGKLALDLGGTHAPASGQVTLDAATASQLGLVNGGMYSIDVFQAERYTCGSDFELTLSGFQHTTSVCSSICGDGIVVGSEVCDDGVNDGSYGGCMPGCMARAPYCGDGVVSDGEQCDDGPQNGAGSCSSTCTLNP